MNASVSDQTSEHARRLTKASRIVVKIGSSLLINKATGELNRAWLESLASELAELMAKGQEVILVSSGAIALGRAYLNMQPGQHRLDEHQAAAAAGQVILAHGYQELMGAHTIKVAQVLLTPDDTEDRRRYLNARSTLETLMGLGVLPVINENDTVTTQEIRYGDNDRLAARVAEMVSADCLVLLSDVDGLYDSDPTEDSSAQLISEVKEITPELEAVAGKSQTAYGSGGMATKLAAARICMSAGCAALIASGQEARPLAAVMAGSNCTWFLPSKTPLAARKQWIAGMLIPAGQLVIDEGAEKALQKGGSLLSVGVQVVQGKFERGDAVSVTTADGRAIAHGLIAYSSDEAQIIKGVQSQEIEQRLGYQGREELIHRDNLVLLECQ
ncbi:MAG: glutamate 5-kinase [Gammaproteobacteria bacterium]|nr:glutamate 5-kinase [Gammaproteobacteria bacterium]MCP4090065.1 glutamate 5-kinase [Gammaproteobacteria bacterium]MCP4277045.1 glutamate 5-kinase [Gammaproteobacteria bacterium]MCP4832732.1 glutamate 5-kinase [Gammaproteobacteria bacterium]MCP4929925.1 glutamate 5-kinase [Gammaproteobacteria bacterium]